MDIKDKYMRMALQEAEKAMLHNDVPIGCVIVFEDKIIASSHNKVELAQDSTSHAEMLAIRDALKTIEYKHLLECDMYVTLEPCPMCAGAIVLSRIRNIYIATKDSKSGACGSILNIASNENLNHRCNLYYGILEQESSQLIKHFFKKLRMKNGRSS